jgi:uncharacterized membrane protein YeaQ/YmgE (transglycosylase-associated protein family)
MVNLMAWLMIGALVGWLAAQLLRLTPGPALFVNVLLGMLGASLAGWLLAPIITPPGSVLDGAAVALLGAVLLLVLANCLPHLLRRR